MLDVFWQGISTRTTPEDPSVPVVDVTQKTIELGGAARVAIHAAQAGVSSLFCARVGLDTAGVDLQHALKNKNVPPTFLIKDETKPTTVKTRILNKGVYLARMDEEDTTPLPPNLLKPMLEEVRQQADVLTISDYGKGMVTPETLALMKHIWADGQIILDPKIGQNLDYTSLTALKPNLAEAAFLLGEKSLENTDDVAAATAQQLLEKYDLKIILLTRSEAGVTLLEKGGEATHIPNPPIAHVGNVSGAGDAVLAAFSVALVTGKDALTAAHQAVQAGANFVTT